MIGITERGDAALDTRWDSWVSQGNPAILITKDPLRLASFLDGIENVIIHCTITGFGGTIIEPYVPTVIKAVEGMNVLFNRFGHERVVLRIDPIIPTEKGVVRAQEVFAYRFQGQRVRISFLDMYTHVKERFLARGIQPPYQSLHAPLDKRKLIAEFFEEAEICGEPGFKCIGCVSKKDRVIKVDSTKVDSLRQVLSKLENCTYVYYITTWHLPDSGYITISKMPKVESRLVVDWKGLQWLRYNLPSYGMYQSLK